MAQKIVLEPGKTICFEGTTYRILSINGGLVDLVEVEGSKLNAISVAMELFADIDPKRVFEIADTFGPKEVSVTERQKRSARIDWLSSRKNVNRKDCRR